MVEAVKPEGYDRWLEGVQWQVHNRGVDYASAFGLEAHGEEAGAFAYTRFRNPENRIPTSGDNAGDIPEALRSGNKGEAVEIEPEPSMTMEQ